MFVTQDTDSIEFLSPEPIQQWLSWRLKQSKTISREEQVLIFSLTSARQAKEHVKLCSSEKQEKGSV